MKTLTQTAKHPIRSSFASTAGGFVSSASRATKSGKRSDGAPRGQDSSRR